MMHPRLCLTLLVVIALIIFSSTKLKPDLSEIVARFFYLSLHKFKHGCKSLSSFSVVVMRTGDVRDPPSTTNFVHPSQNSTSWHIHLNYHSWYRAMRLALLPKNQLQFITGQISMPSKDDQLYPTRLRCMQCFGALMATSFSFTINCSEFSMDRFYSWCVEWCFSQGNSCISQRQEKTYSSLQGVLLTGYFTQLKTLWYEFHGFHTRFLPALVQSLLTLIAMGYQQSDEVIRLLL